MADPRGTEGPIAEDDVRAHLDAIGVEIIDNVTIIS